MSVQAMAWAIEQQVAKHPTQRLVLICLANYCDKDGDSAFPAVSTLALDTGLSRRQVQRCLRSLEALRLIARSNRKLPLAHIGRADRIPECYRVLLPRGVTVSPRDENEASHGRNGASHSRERGVTQSPNPSFIRQEPKRRAHAREKAPLCVRCAENESVMSLKGNRYCFKCSKIVLASDQEAASELAQRVGSLLPKRAQA